MSAVFNAATAVNVNVLRTTNALFQITQKRVATGKAIFSAADDAPKYIMSDRMISRSRSLEALNSGISTNLGALQSNDKTLNKIKTTLEEMEKTAMAAINTSGARGLTAAPTAAITDSTAVANAGEGHRLSITSDSGRNFTFNFTGAVGSTTWGQVATALNEANIGVTMRFTQGAGGNRMVLEATDGKTGFTIDGASSRQVVNNFASLNSSYDGAFNPTAGASRFVDGTSMPTGFGGTNPAGLRFGLGGIVTNASGFSNSSVSAGTSLTFQGADGVARTWSTRTDKNLDDVVREINALNAGVKAEFVASVAGAYRISLRNTQGGNMVVLNGTGLFDSGGGIGRFNVTSNPRVEGTPREGEASVEGRLKLGKVYDGARSEIGGYIANNVAPQGRNLLAGNSITIFLNEFSTPGGNDGLVIRGHNLTVRGVHLNMEAEGSTWNSLANIQNAKDQITAAKERVLQLQAEFGTFMSMVKERLETNKDFASGIKALGDEIVAADIGEESAKLTALQTQQQFAVQAFTAGSQNSQGLLRLLG